MGLINDQQRKSSGVKTPVIKPIRAALPELEPAPIPAEVTAPGEVIAPDEVTAPGEVTAPEEVSVPEEVTNTPAPQPNLVNPLTGKEETLDFLPADTSDIQPKFEPQRIPETPALWQPDLTPESSRFGVNVSSHKLPSFSAAPLKSTGQSDAALGIMNDYLTNSRNEEASRQYAEAQKVQRDVSDILSLPNVPDVTKPLYTAPLDFLGNVIFGTENARKLADEGKFDLSRASFGRAGSGIIGGLGYVTSVLGNTAIGAIGETNKLVANSLQSAGVSKEMAEGIARDGLFHFTPGYINTPGKTLRVRTLPNGKEELYSEQNRLAIKPSTILNFNFDEAKKRNLIADGIFGEAVGDINDPAGAEKYGRIFTRQQRWGNDNAFKDPQGLGLQVLSWMVNPGELLTEKIFGTAVRKVFGRGLANITPTAKFTPTPSLDLPALPSAAMRAEQNLKRTAGEARNSQAWRAFTTEKPKDLNQFFVENLREVNKRQTERLNGQGLVRVEKPPTAIVNQHSVFWEPDMIPMRARLETSKPPSTAKLLPPGIDLNPVRTRTVAEREMIEEILNPSKPLPKDPTPGINAFSDEFSTKFTDANTVNTNIPRRQPIPYSADIEIPKVSLAGELTLEETPVFSKLTNAFSDDFADDFIDGDSMFSASARADDLVAPDEITDIDFLPLEPIDIPGKIDFTMPERDFMRAYEDEIAREASNLEPRYFSNKPFASNPVEIPRVYTGTAEVTTKPMPPAIPPNTLPDIPEGKAVDYIEFSSLTPVEFAAAVGVGNPGLYIETAGALVLRPLSEVVNSLRAAAPNLVDDFEGLTWDEFKGHLSNKGVDNTSRFGAVGEPLPDSAKVITERFKDIDALALQRKIEIRASGGNGADALREVDRAVIEQKDAIREELNKKTRRALPPAKTVEVVEPLEMTEAQVDDAIEQFISDAPEEDLFDLEYRTEVDIENSIPELAEEPMFNARFDAGSNKEMLDSWLEQVDDWVNAVESGRFGDLGEEEVARAISLAKTKTDEVLESFRALTNKGAGDEVLKINADVEKRIAEAKAAYQSKIDALDGTFSKPPEGFLFSMQHKYELEIKAIRERGEELKRRLFDGEKTGDVAAKADEIDEAVNRRVAAKETEANIKPPQVTDDDLRNAVAELAAFKQYLQAPMKQLEELFDETVDFSRRALDEPVVQTLDEKRLLASVRNGGVTKLPGYLKKRLGAELVRAVSEGTLVDYAKKTGESLEALTARIASENNKAIDEFSAVSPNLVKEIADSVVPTPTWRGYHGSALSGWKPPEKLYANGSRGELGHGTYFSKAKRTAIDYSSARVSDNANPLTNDFDLKPNVGKYEFKHKSVLSARQQLPNAVVKEILSSLPKSIRETAVEAAGERKLKYNQIKELVEATIAKEGIEPSEEYLTLIDANLSRSLRRMGIDGVLDNSNGTFLSLDNSKLKFIQQENTGNPSILDSAVARYNVDALSKLNYPGLLTTDANLRDSAYRLLAQKRAQVDDKLSELQQKMIERMDLDDSAVLGKLNFDDGKPKTFQEAIDTLLDSDVCNI